MWNDTHNVCRRQIAGATAKDTYRHVMRAAGSSGTVYTYTGATGG